MKTETEIRERVHQLIEKMKVIKEEGKLEKNNRLIYSDLMNETLTHLTEIGHLYWLLDEPVPKDILDLTRI